MPQFLLSNFSRLILNTEDDSDSPVSEELTQTLREIIVGLLILMLDTGDSGSATSNPPNDATGILTDTGAAYSVDEHNGRTLLITSGNAKGLIYTIDDTTATTIVCTGDNLYSDGMRSADTYKILYDLKVNLDGHDHDGVNSKSVVLGAGVVTQSKLATSTSTASCALGTWGNYVSAGGEYSFYPQVKVAGANNDDCEAQILGPTTGLTTSYQTIIALNDATSGSIHYYQRYITASGEIFWLFILRNKLTKKIVAAIAAPDHPCFGNGGKPNLVPHPFPGYDSEKYEIVLINPSLKEVAEIKSHQTVEDDNIPDKDFLDVFFEEYEIDETSNPAWPTEKVTVGLPPDWNEAWFSQTPVQPIKKVIPKSDYILCKKLKKRK